MKQNIRNALQRDKNQQKQRKAQRWRGGGAAVWSVRPTYPGLTMHQGFEQGGTKEGICLIVVRA